MTSLRSLCEQVIVGSRMACAHKDATELNKKGAGGHGGRQKVIHLHGVPRRVPFCIELEW